MPKNVPDTPRPSDEHVWEQLREVVRHAYPNPERNGCPSDDIIRRLALDIKSVRSDDPLIAHVTQCSPCLNEIQKYREDSENIPRSSAGKWPLQK